MPKPVSLAALAVLVFVLAGCQLKSAKPLLQASDGVAVYAGDILVVSLDDDGAISLNDKAGVNSTAFGKTGDFYVADHDGKRQELSFHRLAGQRGLSLEQLYLAQLTAPDGSAAYGLVRPAAGRLLVKTIALDTDMRAALKKLGYDIGYADSTTTAGDREALMAAVNAFIRVKGESLAAFTQGDLNYAVAVGAREVETLSGLTLQVRCLAAAGHPYDPAMRAIARKFRTGLQLADIDAGPARELCGRAVRAAPSPSVGYAYARALFLEQDYPAFRARIETLRRLDFPLAHVFAADVLIRGTGGAAKDPAAAREILERSADAHPLVRYFLGFYLRNGMLDGTPDYARAAVLFESAMNDGFAPARVDFGKLQRAGLGIGKDPVGAYRNFQAAAKAGVGAGAMEAGRALYFGYGVPADKARGLELLRAAAAAGDRNAQSYLKQVDKAQDPLSVLSGVPAERKAELERVMDGKPFELTYENIPFMAGLGRVLMANCGSPRNAGEKAELAAFVTTAASGLAFGTDYSNPDLGKGVGSMTRHTALQALGEEVGNQVSCGAASEKLASGLARAIKSNAQGPGGGESTFVSTCRSQFNKGQCECLANTARVAIPDVHRRPYRRAIIKEMIQRNPILGLQVGIACGITNY